MTWRGLIGCSVLASFDYRPYGSNYAGSGMAATVDGPNYTGHVADADTNFVYMQARYYDPGVGRFISRDPAGLKAGFNDFAYVGDNPINKTDPTGLFECATQAACAVGTQISNTFKEAQKNYKPGSAAFNKLETGIKALGTANDGNGVNVVLTNKPKDGAVGHGSYDKRSGTETLTINTAQLNQAGYTPRQNQAEFAATGMHELKHILDDVAKGDTPHTPKDEFWHEVRGVRAETPIWEGLKVDDPLKTWTQSGGLNMKAVYAEAQWSTNVYCPNGKCL